MFRSWQHLFTRTPAPLPAASVSSTFMVTSHVLQQTWSKRANFRLREYRERREEMREFRGVLIKVSSAVAETQLKGVGTTTGHGHQRLVEGQLSYYSTDWSSFSSKTKWSVNTMSSYSALFVPVDGKPAEQCNLSIYLWVSSLWTLALEIPGWSVPRAR